MLTEQLKLEEGETVLKDVRKHWFILLSQSIGVVVSALMPLVLFLFSDLFATSNVPVPATAEVFEGYAVFFYAVWLLIAWMTLFGIWTDYYLDMWIITTRRVIAVDQQGFFRRKVASFRLERLQNVTIDIHGIIATLLNFGHITAETAGNTEAFVIHGVPDPGSMKALIQEYADQVVGSGAGLGASLRQAPNVQSPT